MNLSKSSCLGFLTFAQYSSLLTCLPRSIQCRIIFMVLKKAIKSLISSIGVYEEV